MKKIQKKHLTLPILLTLLAGGVLWFGGDRYNNIDDDIVIPAEFIFQGKTIALAWTDDNAGEDLIIQSDRKEYSGFNEIDVYFSITNTNKEDQEMDVVVWVGNEKVEVKEILKIDRDNNFQFPISNFQSISNDQFSNSVADIKDKDQKTTSNEMALSASAGANTGLINSSKSIADEKNLSRDSNNLYMDVEVSGIEPERLGLISPVSQPATPTSELLYHNSDVASIPNRKDIKGFTDGYAVNDNIKSGETNFYKAKIKYPPMSDGEFFIEAFGKAVVGAGRDLPLRDDASAYGHLDPWFSSSWTYRRQIIINHSEVADVADPETTYLDFPVLFYTG